MSRQADEAITIARPDLRIAAVVVSVRFRNPEAEQERLALVDELLREESNLGRALAGHARHALSESRGSHSNWDIVADAEEVYAMLVRYEAIVRRMANIYGALVASIEARAAEQGTGPEASSGP